MLTPNRHFIICLGRQVGCGGLTIARHLARVLDCKVYDKELINMAAKESGFAEQFFEKNDEHKGFFHTITHLHLPFASCSNIYRNNLSDENLYKLQSDVIREVADRESCIFVGRTADYILRDRPYVMSVFITAPLADRIMRVSESRHLTREEALKFIRESEAARSSYYNYYTGKRWGAAESYDLCIDSSLLGIAETERLIAEVINKKFQ